MYLEYSCFDFTLLFNEEVFFSVPPAFVFRSVLGYQLKKLCCIATKTQCQDCHFRVNCAYASLFETILEKDNEVLAGRTRASHPYTIQVFHDAKKSYKEISFRIILLGKYIKFFPYVYFALQKAGEDGILKQRHVFTIKSIENDGKSILIKDDKIETNLPTFQWKFEDKNKETYEGDVLVQLLTPLRFKVAGKYTDNFEVKDFFDTIERRMLTLCSLYGKVEDFEIKGDVSSINMSNQNIKWEDQSHYSARQKKAMKLGGCIGDFTLSGSFSGRELALLEFAELFQAGKNTNFGLGKIDCWKK